jgi:hypothetical protein
LGFATLVALGVFSLVVLIIIIECLIFGGWLIFMKNKFKLLCLLITLGLIEMAIVLSLVYNELTRLELI